MWLHLTGPHLGLLSLCLCGTFALPVGPDSLLDLVLWARGYLSSTNHFLIYLQPLLYFLRTWITSGKAPKKTNTVFSLGLCFFCDSIPHQPS